MTSRAGVLGSLVGMLIVFAGGVAITGEVLLSAAVAVAGWVLGQVLIVPLIKKRGRDA